MISKSLHLTPTNFQVKWISHHLTSKLKNKQIRYCFSTLEPQYLLKFSSKVTSPHLIKNLGDFKVTSYHPKIEVILNHLTSPQKKMRWFQSHLTSPRKNWGDFKITSSHLKKIEVILKSFHLTSPHLVVIYIPAWDWQSQVADFTTWDFLVPGYTFHNLGLSVPGYTFHIPGLSVPGYRIPPIKILEHHSSIPGYGL